jgi:capsular exopolysaccharide synthesis family protein
LALAYIIFKEDCSGKVLFRSNVEKQTNLPVISEITYHRQPKSPRTSALDNAILTKEFSQIQAALGLFNEGNTRKTLLVTSLLLNEGTSFVSRNLAIKLAATGKKVVLLDLNLLKTDTSRAFDVQQATGFSDFFQGNHDISHLLHKSKHANLDIMPVGHNSGNTVTLLMHPRVGELFASLKSRYDFLIIDAPPLELASDASALSRFIDTTILVVRHGVTPKTTLKRLDENVEVKNIKDVHIVLNGIRARGFPRRYFGYGFGYGYERIPKKQLLKLAKQA